MSPCINISKTLVSKTHSLKKKKKKKERKVEAKDLTAGAFFFFNWSDIAQIVLQWTTRKEHSPGW